MSGPHLNEREMKCLIATAFIALAVRFVWFYASHASVDLLFSDQWLFFESVFSPHSLWEKFAWQHGPHRQGLWIFFYFLFLAPFRWLARPETVGMCLLTIAAGLGFLRLKRRLQTPWDISDVLIPCFFFTLLSYETFIITPNAAHGVLPLLLLVLLGLAWTQEDLFLRYGSVVFLNFLEVFTGFGLLVGVLTPLLLLLRLALIRGDPLRTERRLAAAALGLSVVSMALFFKGYDFGASLEPLSRVRHSPLEYFEFSARIMSSMAGVPARLKLVVGAVLFSGLAWIFLLSLRALIRERGLSRDQALVITLFSGFTLLFCLVASWGRIHNGRVTADASRYVLYIVPGACAALLYLQLSSRSPFFRGLIIAVTCAAFAAECARPTRKEYLHLLGYIDGKQTWIDIYRRTGDVETATREAGFPICGDDLKDARLKEMLDWMKARRLSCFADRPERLKEASP